MGLGDVVRITTICNVEIENLSSSTLTKKLGDNPLTSEDDFSFCSLKLLQKKLPSSRARLAQTVQLLRSYTIFRECNLALAY